MYKKNKIIKTLFVAVAILLTCTASAQNYKSPEETSLMHPMSTVDTVLLILAVILLLPVIIMGRSFMASVKVYWEKQKAKNTMLKVLLPLAFTLLCMHASAQDAANAANTAAPAAPGNSWPATTWALFTAVLLEVAVLLFFSISSLKFIKRIMGIETEATEAENAAAVETVKKETLWHKIWRRINNFKSIEEEVSMDTGHNYDGIRELDNRIPPWFTAAFVITIIFACTYLLRYHVFHSAPLSLEEYKNEMALAAAEHEEYVRTHADLVDENNVKMLGTDDIAAGKAIYTEKCSPCHLADGGGNVGPNLTDDYWIHGGSISSVFKSVKYGWPDKGMIAWKDQYSDKQINELASFVKSLHGTKPQTAKEPQGELYKDSTTSAPAKDTSLVKSK